MGTATTADGTALYFCEQGTGDPVLLVAGQAQDHHSWDAVAELLPGRLLRFDHRGIGLSPEPPGPYSVRQFASDAVAVLDAAGVQRAHVVGHSMGGRVAQWLGIEHVERVRSLVISASTPGDARGVRRSASAEAALRSGDPGRQAELLFTPGWLAGHREQALRAPRRSAQAVREHFAASQAHDSWDRLPGITAPTLVITGADDELNPAANSPLLAGRIPGAELVVVPGGRHGYTTELADTFASVVAAFQASA